MLILASDPGLHGALAAYDEGRRSLTVVDMPTQTREMASRKLRDTVDELELISFFSTWAGMGATTLYLEQVGGMPGQSAHGAYMFGSYVTAVRVAAKAAGLVVHEVTPARWKAAMRAPKDKDGARLRASELLPAFSHLWPLKKHDGRAEAALLALYGAQRGGAKC
jgi:hypothetical protein